MQNPIGEADLEWILHRNCEGTEQLRINKTNNKRQWNLPVVMLPGGFLHLQHRSRAKSSQANSLFCIRMKIIADNQKGTVVVWRSLIVL